jgi:methionyl-tRNA formyltransferase
MELLRVVFIGMELSVLTELTACPVDLLGAYLPAPPRWISRPLWPAAKIISRSWKKRIKAAAHADPLAIHLAAHNIPALPAASVNAPAFAKKLGQLDPDLGVVANFGEILGARLLRLPRLGFINLHPSLLPRYRGARPFERILANGETKSGATWHRMTIKIDSGEILAQEEFSIEPGCTARELGRRSISVGVKLLRPLLREIEDGTIAASLRGESEVSNCVRLAADEKRRSSEDK